MLAKSTNLVLLISGLTFSTFVQSENEDLFDLSLEQLLDLTVSSASGLEESLRDAPATMVIISALDIKQRGYTSLDEIILDLPGFDTSQTHGNGSITSYQRGYRTPFTQRTLLLINGTVDNHLWTQGASFSKFYPMSNIEHIEVLYGPASAVYGPNAFLGIINVITKDAEAYLEKSDDKLDLSIQTGSYNTQSFDLTASGHFEKFSYNLAAKYYSSDEPAIKDYAPWGFLSETMLANRDIWGPVIFDTALSNECNTNGCPHSSRNHDFGGYHDPSINWGILADAKFEHIKAGLILWEMKESYGPYYPSDRAQPGILWNRSSRQIFLEHKKDIKENLAIKTLFLNRKSDIWGGWAEAFPGSTMLSGPEALSWVSISDWNSINTSWLFKQDYDFTYNKAWRISGGLKYEYKELTKAYDVCGYWADTFCTSGTSDTAGSGIATSTDDTINIQPPTLGNMPDSNLVNTTDKGVYIQGIWHSDLWRMNVGARYDKNSIYGSSVNPRVSAVYYLSDKTTVKFLYGKAFQEPPAIQLYGGWSGRTANPDLKPEKAQNLEMVFMFQQEHWLHDMSFFTARYKNVIKEEADNAGDRDTYGFEYRGKFQFANFLTASDDITGHVYYTFTKTKSSVTYDHNLGLWVGEGITNCEQLNEDHNINYDPCADANINLGDIAPHKINMAINLPWGNNWNLNLKANWVASKELYLRNPLRAQGTKNDAYFVMDMNLIYQFEPFSLSLKVKNLFDKDYYHSGVESASSGNDFSKRSLGWHNSLIPQTGRNFMLTLNMRF